MLIVQAPQFESHIMKLSKILVALLISAFALNGQNSITLESIWQENTFATKSVPGFNFLNDGRHYTRLEDNTIKKYDIISGDWVEDLFKGSDIKGQLGFEGTISGYSFSDDESMILIDSEREPIFRRSYLAKYHVYDLKSKQLHALYEDGKVMNASFSPDARYVAYVYDNNLYYYNLSNRETLPITSDGVINEVINGSTDWVYEEEFSIVKAFWWSPDSKKIAYLRFDETEVPLYTMIYHLDQPYPKYSSFKYPKVGEKNSSVSVHMYDLDNENSQSIDIGNLEDMYIPRVQWTKDPNEVCIFKLNRHQNHLQLYLASSSGQTRILLEEKNKYYIDIHDHLTFLKDGKHFIWASEKDGFNHLYLYDMDGSEKCDLTKGDFDVTDFYGVDETNDEIYYQAAEISPMQREIYRINTKGKKKKLLTTQGGVNSAQFSSTYDYYTLNHTTINSPSTYTVFDRDGKSVRLIESNSNATAEQKKHRVQPVEFFSFKTSEQVLLNGWMIKPVNFDPTKKYPVFMFQYSGPGSQQVIDSWRGTNYWWFQMLSQKGYLIACVDGRGTGARGEEFKKMSYLRLGHYETIDQIEAAKYLGSLPYTDASRIGIFGWSYGGYMSSLCILKGNDIFKAAIAVAPVTNWKWYDSIYTERYMRTSEENPKGYADNSPVYFADRLKGQYLLIHGGTDDNVHLQNTMEMANALIEANKQFDTYIYPNRNHGISGGNARLHLYTKMTDFLDENLMQK